MEYLADKVIKQKAGQSRAKPRDGSVSAATVAVGVLPRKPAWVVAKQIRAGQKCCQYVDSKTGKRCHSTWQVDHKQSYWAGGNHQTENLQLLCAGHNKMKYRTEAGLRLLS